MARWFFLNSELKSPKGCAANDEFVAYPMGSELGVIVYRNGEVSNRWEDGTAGVPEDIRELADDENSLHKPCINEDGSWREVIVDDDETLVRILR